jgi:hypothetical protein
MNYLRMGKSFFLSCGAIFFYTGPGYCALKSLVLGRWLLLVRLRWQVQEARQRRELVLQVVWEGWRRAKD